MTRNYATALALVVVLALAGGLFAYQAHSNTVIHNGQVDGCKRGNLIRQTLHDFLHEAAQSRRNLAMLNTGKIRAENLDASRHYSRLYKKFLVLDCEKAYPKP